LPFGQGDDVHRFTDAVQDLFRHASQEGLREPSFPMGSNDEDVAVQFNYLFEDFGSGIPFRDPNRPNNIEAFGLIFQLPVGEFLEAVLDALELFFPFLTLRVFPPPCGA
jgi:hypothetical protein